jgi:DNA-binding NarL/FixJ family response regulator
MSTHSQPTVRVVLADMSRMTQELIRRVLEEKPGIQVVCDASELTIPLRQLVDETDAEVLIVGSDALDLLSECHELLEDRACLRVLSVDGDGRGAHVHGLRPYDLGVDELSREFVLEVVSDASTPHAGRHR